jgi:hypothetical protein
MNSEELKQRTKSFGLAIIQLVEEFPTNRTANGIGNHLLRSATSVGANYRSACRAQSKPTSSLVPSERVEFLYREANELVAILTASAKTAKNNLQRK